MIEKSVAKFLVACGQTFAVNNEEQAVLYKKLIDEELKEFSNPESDENELKELCDLIWVLIGYGHSKGWNMTGALNELVSSNMSKISPTGKVLKNEYGKVIKPDTYIPANMKPFLGATRR